MWPLIFQRHFSLPPAGRPGIQEAFELNGILNPLQYPLRVKKETFEVSTALVCWVHDDAFAQGLSSLRSAFHEDRGLRARPAAGQCPAPMLDTLHAVAGIKRVQQSGNRARRGELLILRAAVAGPIGRRVRNLWLRC